MRPHSRKTGCRGALRPRKPKEPGPRRHPSRPKNRDQTPRAGDRPEIAGSSRCPLYRAARLRHDAFIIDQEIERAKSRAIMVRERNLRMLEAARSDPHKARPAKVKEWQDLVASASLYLAALEDKLALDALAVSRWQREALQCEERARVIQAAFDRPVETGQAAGKSSAAPARSDPAQPEPPGRLSISPTLLASVAAARERQRLQREADEKFMEEWLQRQREKEAAAKSAASEDRANGGQERKAVKPMHPQMPSRGFDLGR